jgi:ABC-type glycerol-3-phosphate transport system permease component
VDAHDELQVDQGDLCVAVHLPARPALENYSSAWTTAGIGNFFFNTVFVVGSALVLVMLLGSMCAYILARFEFPGNRIIYYMMLGGLMIPIFLAIVPLFFVLQNLGLLNTLPGLVVRYVAFALPFTGFFLYALFRSLPYEISEAAAIDGANEWRTFFQIMLPMAKPGLVAIVSGCQPTSRPSSSRPPYSASECGTRSAAGPGSRRIVTSPGRSRERWYVRRSRWRTPRASTPI